MPQVPHLDGRPLQRPSSDISMGASPRSSHHRDASLTRRACAAFLSTLALALPATAISLGSAHAAPPWHDGWCRIDETGHAVVVDLSRLPSAAQHRIRQAAPDLFASRNWLVRCSSDVSLHPGPKSNPLGTDEILEAVGIRRRQFGVTTADKNADSGEHGEYGIGYVLVDVDPGDKLNPWPDDGTPCSMSWPGRDSTTTNCNVFYRNNHSFVMVTLAPVDCFDPGDAYKHVCLPEDANSPLKRPQFAHRPDPAPEPSDGKGPGGPSKPGPSKPGPSKPGPSKPGPSKPGPSKPGPSGPSGDPSKPGHGPSGPGASAPGSTGHGGGPSAPSASGPSDQGGDDVPPAGQGPSDPHPSGAAPRPDPRHDDGGRSHDTTDVAPNVRVDRPGARVPTPSRPGEAPTASSSATPTTSTSATPTPASSSASPRVSSPAPSSSDTASANSGPKPSGTASPTPVWGPDATSTGLLHGAPRRHPIATTLGVAGLLLATAGAWFLARRRRDERATTTDSTTTSVPSTGIEVDDDE